ncbi:uncharacterized protein At1g24485 [Ziziphus jujuba]|uniref:Uncharacterized protein At1g24485 n=1 Tax=Ziziphus jujuba TaxID=326968 RepID=A0A6P6FYY0_ZIZJJ|nr:uncharacterized protein At1g24485 [Ziziphus jujuba]
MSSFRCRSLLVVIISVVALWASKPCFAVFQSIDCGASESYTDKYSIKWVGDDDYVRNGESRQVQFSSSVPNVFGTVRAFPTLRRNCYRVRVDTGERILVRASFYYGNYDRKDSPPTFELDLDGNYWTKVNLTKYLSLKIVDFEVIYTVRNNATSICLTQTLPGHIPFISTLELRSLAPKMYGLVGPDYALFTHKRTALGAYQIIKYPEDGYDREWFPGYGLGSEEVRNEALSIDVSPAPDSPPVAALRNATTANNTMEYIRLVTNLPEDFEVPVYITAYFSEVIDSMRPTDKRSFQICIDDQPYSKPIIPPFGSVAQVSIYNVTASYNTSFTVVATSDSTLPPLINAFEVYSVSDPLTPGTHFKDVQGLSALQMEFKVLLTWTGDPCLPSPYSWEWVVCSKDPIPRVVALNLSSFGLFGSLPDFGSMDALVTIDLHNNSLNGPIPEFLGLFPKLRLLDLSDNRFNGTIPTSLITKKNLKFVVNDNCLSGMTCPPPPPEENLTPPTPLTSSSHSKPDDKNYPPSPLYPSDPHAYGDVFQTPSFSASNKQYSDLLLLLLGAATIQLLLLSFLLL